MRRMGTIARLALVVFALLSNLHLLRQSTGAVIRPIGNDEVTLFEKRFEGLRRELPAHGVVGYVSDGQPKDIRFGPAAVEYYLTQYALSPTIVVDSPEPRLVVGNFRKPDTSVNVIERNKLTLLRDFGDGVMLLGHRVE